MVDVYKSTYSHVDVYESTINNIPLMRRCDDDWVNATQILKIAGLGKAQRTRVLEKEVHNYVHRKIQGGHGKFQGTWVPLEFAKGLALRHNIPIETLPVLYYDPETNDPLPDKPLAIKTKTTGNASAKNRASNSKAASSSSTLNKEKKRSLNLKSNSFPANGSKLTSPQKSKKDSNTTNTFGTNNPVSGLPPTFGMFHSATEPDFHKQNFTSPPDGSGSQQVQSHQLEAQRELHMLQKQQQQHQQHPIAGAPPTIGLADKIPPFYPSHQTNRSISSVPDVVSAQLREENDLNTHVSPSFYVMHETNVKRHQQNYLQPRYQQYTNLQYNQNNNTNREKLNYQQLAPQFQHSNSQPGHGVIHNREAFEAPNKILKHSRHHSSPHVVQQQPQSNYQIQQQHKQLQQQQQQQQQQQLQHQHQQLQQQHQQLQHQQHQQHQHQHQHQQHQQQQQQNLQYDSQENVSTQPFLDNQEYYTTQLLSFFINDSPVPEFLFNPPSDFDINRAIDDEGHTPLHWASALAAVDIIKLLVDHNADTLMLNDAGMNPLSKLIHFSNSYDWKNFHIILPLLKHCLVVPDANQRTPLHYLMEFSAVPNKVESSHYYFYEILKFIKHQQKEAERYYPDTNNNRQLLQVLINHVDINGDTALYLALKAQSHDFIVELLKNGADIEKVGIHNIPPEILKEVQLSGKITSLDNMNIGVNVDMNTNMDTRMNANISTNGNMNTNINTSMNMMNMSQNNHSNVQNGLQRKIQAASQHLNMTNAFLADSPSVLSPQDVHHSNLLSNNSDNSILKIDSTNDIIQQNNEEEKNPFLVSKYDTSPEIKNKGTPHTILVQRTPESQLCYPEDKENIFDSTLNEPLTSAKLALNSTSTPQKENRVANEQSIADVTENRNTTFDEDTMIIKPSKISITEVDNFVKKLPEMVSYLKRSLENKTDHLSYNVETINKLNLEISSLSMKNSKFLKKISKVAKSDKDIDYLKIANSPSSIIDNFTSSNISRINTTLVNKSDKLLDLYERSQALEVAKLVNNEEVTIREEPAESYQNKLELAIHLTLLQIKRRKIVEQTLELYLNDGVDDDDFYFDEDAIDDNMSSEDADDFRMMRSKISVYKKLISSICGLPEKEINSDLLNEIENVLS